MSKKFQIKCINLSEQETDQNKFNKLEKMRKKEKAKIKRQKLGIHEKKDEKKGENFPYFIKSLTKPMQALTQP